MSLISATHYVYSYGEGLNAVETRTFGNEKTARMWAAEVLGTITVTNGTYHRDLGRAGQVDMRRLTRLNKKSHRVYSDESNESLRYWITRQQPCGQVLPKVAIVPSVGELGYW